MSVMKVKRHATLLLLSLLSLLLVALAAQATPAPTRPFDASRHEGLGFQQRATGSGTSTSANDPRQGDGFDVRQPAGITQDVTTAAAQPAASSGTSTTTWIVVGTIAAALSTALAAWALLRRRRHLGESASAAYCAHHTEDAVCSTA